MGRKSTFQNFEIWHLYWQLRSVLLLNWVVEDADLVNLQNLEGEPANNEREDFDWGSRYKELLLSGSFCRSERKIVATYQAPLISESRLPCSPAEGLAHRRIWIDSRPKRLLTIRRVLIVSYLSTRRIVRVRIKLPLVKRVDSWYRAYHDVLLEVWDVNVDLAHRHDPLLILSSLYLGLWEDAQAGVVTTSKPWVSFFNVQVGHGSESRTTSHVTCITPPASHLV